MKLLLEKFQSRTIPLLLLMLLVTACASRTVNEDTKQTGQQVAEPLDENTQEKSEPSPSLTPRLPEPRPRQMVSAPPPPDENRFDFAASDVPAREFFMSLVEGSPVNMVVHPLVTGEITIDLKNTTIAEVLQIVHNVYGYPYFKTGNVYQVMPAAMQARTFHLNYLNLVRKGISQTLVSSGQITNKDNSRRNNNNDNSNNNDNAYNNETQRNDIHAGSLINTKSTADFWDELKQAIEILIGNEDGRKVIVQPQASVVVVVAMPDELLTVDMYLKTIQSNLQRQVIIEAKVIDVSLSEGYQTGINWGALKVTDGGNKYLFGQTGGGTVFDDGLSEGAGAGGSVRPGQSLPDSLAAQAFGGVFSMAVSLDNFQAFVELLGTQGDVKILSSPRISTVNNQKAMIKVGSDEFFVTDISSNTSVNTSTNTSNDITLTPFFSGIALDVTPQISPDGLITMHIHPSISKVEDQQKEFEVFGEELSIPLAYSTVRESDSIVHARSGQLVVIGGLMQEFTTEEQYGIPLLMDIPILGWLFRQTQMLTRKSELVILLRPQIVEKPQYWEQTLDSARKRFQEMSPDLEIDIE